MKGKASSMGKKKAVLRKPKPRKMIEETARTTIEEFSLLLDKESPF